MSDFCHLYPEHELYPDALFWMAESFFADYDFETARSLYSRILDSYPSSAVYSDSKMRLEEISRREREEKLLYLLKVTGEENLSTREDFERQLRQYQAEDKIDIRKQLADAKSRNEELEKELASLRSAGVAMANTESVPQSNEQENPPAKEESAENVENPQTQKIPASLPQVASAPTNSENPASSNSPTVSDSQNPTNSSASNDGEVFDKEEYERELDNLRKKARRIQQIMDELQFGNEK